MSDPILLFLAVDVVALLLLGIFAAIVPLAGAGFIVSGVSGLGVLLCLPSLLLRMEPSGFTLPVGPPGLSLHFALDPLSACFLIVVFVAGTAVAAVQSASLPRTPVASIQITVFCLGGTAVALLAADGVALAIGLAITCGAIWLTQAQGRSHAALLIPLLVLAAVCLITPPGFAPRFDTIRAAPVDPDHATAAAAMVVSAATCLVWIRPRQHCWTSDALTAGVVVPSAFYLLLRLVADLSGSAAQNLWGFALLVTGGVTAVIQGWRSVAQPEIDTAVAYLTQRQAGLAMTGVGLAMIARTADLPGAASFAFAATLLSAIGGGIAGCVASLAAHAMGGSAGTYRLSRLGGLIHRMPWTSAALAAGLLGFAAVPPSFGFACLWLLFQSILSAPRASGLLFQLPLALVAAAIALAASLATAASVRLIGIAILGRPRTPQGAGAQEGKTPTRAVLLILSALSLLVGVLPGSALWLLADPAIRALTGAPPGGHIGVALLASTTSSPSYLALPVLALLALATGAVTLARRRSRKDIKTVGFWADGMDPPVGLPFGDPAAQSAGAGFLPTLPDAALPGALLPGARPSGGLLPGIRVPNAEFPGIAPPRMRWLTAWPGFRQTSAMAGLWFLLAGFGALLLVLSLAG